MKVNAAPRKGLRNQNGSIAEFGPALWLMFLFFIFPLLDMVSFLWGVSTVMLESNWSARQAASSSTYTAAIASLDQTANQLAGFRQFAKVTPQASGAPHGSSIVAVVTNFSSGAQQKYPPPPAAGAIPNDAQSIADNVYQFQVTSSYNVMPLFNFAGFPFLKDIPALGAPVPVTFSSTATIEHPDGLNN